MKTAERIIRILSLLARIGAGVAFAVLIAAVLIQVVTRTLGNSPVWTEELTRFALLYLVAFGAGLALRTGDMVNVDVICEHLPGRAPWVLRLVSAVATAGLALYLIPAAWKYTSIGAMQSSPALGLQMNFVHFTITLLLALLALFALLRVVGMLSGAEDGKPEKAVDAPES
ncbi:TRAP transporter small permease [Salipiger mucosus]|uniref:TRAP transporter small permease protein n=1 Tax=Salipiger mucosus DSM 16094 TaxID=1123237 RepID=S9QSE7_9RHOB|nr:TRAP transporter small permease [Salipiger mucosus]EPX82573.1 TRAP-type C4-dicarboxylate transport system, small permease component [Salipiger mucosus DSM 16094]